MVVHEHIPEVEKLAPRLASSSGMRLRLCGKLSWPPTSYMCEVTPQFTWSVVAHGNGNFACCSKVIAQCGWCHHGKSIFLDELIVQEFGIIMV